MRLVARVFVFASTLLIIIYGILPGLFLLRGGFIVAYVAGRNLLAGVNPILFYRFPYFQSLIDQSQLSTRVFPPLVSTPPSVLVNSLVAIFPPLVSRFLIAAISFGALILLVHISSSLTKSSVRTSYLVLLSSSFALATNFSSSAPMIILTFLFVLSFYALAIKAERASGLALGIIFPFSAFAAIPAVLFLLSKKWKTFLYFILASALIVGFTYLIEGRAALVYYIQKVFPYFLNGKVGNPFSTEYQTAWSFFRRMFVFNVTLNPSPIFASRDAYLLAVSLFKSLIIVPCAYFFYKGVTQEDYRESLTAATFVAVLMSPTGSVFQLVLLAPGIISMAETALEENRLKTARLFLVLYALGCLPIFRVLENYLGIQNLFLLYEEFIVVFLLYLGYLFFQLRKLRGHLLPVRAAITSAVISAVTVTLFLGDRTLMKSTFSPAEPVLEKGMSGAMAFSPALQDGRLTYITSDSASGRLIPFGSSLAVDGRDNCYGVASDQYGYNLAMDGIQSGQPVVYFKTRGADVSFRGANASVSRDGDIGSFESNGKVYLVDLDPREISPLDTLDFLPFRIIASCLNAGIDNEIDFVLDSLNSSFSVVRYDLSTRRISSSQIPFRPSSICAEDDNLYLVHGENDSTEVTVVYSGTAQARLLALRGNIEDMAVLGHNLYFSSDFDRGMNFPTIYRYPLEDLAMKERSIKSSQP